jgi:hypothetical protein
VGLALLVQEDSGPADCHEVATVDVVRLGHDEPMRGQDGALRRLRSPHSRCIPDGSKSTGGGCETTQRAQNRVRARQYDPLCFSCFAVGRNPHALIKGSLLANAHAKGSTC